MIGGALHRQHRGKNTMPGELAMRFDIITIFPEFFSGPLDWGVMRRARSAGIIQTEIHDLRKWTRDRHNTVDDRPFGGGEGMVLKPEPIFEAVESVLGQPQNAQGADTAVVLLSASGKVFRQATASRLSQLRRIVLLCGRYEGVDERVAEHLVDDELSVGDFVLSGGELGAAIIMDSVTRLLPGALGNEDSTRNESFGAIAPELRESKSGAAQKVLPDLLRRVAPEVPPATSGILDFPHFTRPQVFRGWEVPSVLVGGDHQQIRRWRRKAALSKTLKNRPELLVDAPLADEDVALLREIAVENASA
jgi:tRNA (guanine37-N1)-methyltransferase